MSEEGEEKRDLSEFKSVINLEDFLFLSRRRLTEEETEFVKAQLWTILAYLDEPVHRRIRFSFLMMEVCKEMMKELA